MTIQKRLSDTLNEVKNKFDIKDVWTYDQAEEALAHFLTYEQEYNNNPVDGQIRAVVAGVPKYGSVWNGETMVEDQDLRYTLSGTSILNIALAMRKDLSIRAEIRIKEHHRTESCAY